MGAFHRNRNRNRHGRPPKPDPSRPETPTPILKSAETKIEIFKPPGWAEPN